MLRREVTKADQIGAQVGWCVVGVLGRSWAKSKWKNLKSVAKCGAIERQLMFE